MNNNSLCFTLFSPVPVLQTLILVLCILTYISSVISLPIELCFSVFSWAIIYIGGVKSLNTYRLGSQKKNNLDESEEMSTHKSFLSGFLSTLQMVWLFPIISSLFLMLAYVTMKSSIQKFLMMLFIGCTGTLNLASILRSFAIKFGAEGLDKPVPILEKLKWR